MFMRNVLAFTLLSLLMVMSGHAGAQTPGATREEETSVIELITRPLAVRASSWRCSVEHRMQCAGGRCEPGSTQPGWLSVDFPARTYSRCDPKGCDRYEAGVRVSGAFTTIDLAGRATFLKIVNDGSQFIEAASIGVSVIIATGRCAPM